MHNRSRAGLVIIIGAISLSGVGCTTNPGIAKFGSAATALADSYRPILSTPSRLCTQNAALKSFSLDARYDFQQLKKLTGESADCKGLGEAQATRMVVADAIAAYGEALSALAVTDPAALTPDINGIATAAKSIKDRGGDATFDAQRVDALSTFVATLVEWFRAAQARRAARDFMTRMQVPLASLVEEMKIWTQGTVIPRLDTSIELRQFVLRDLVQQSTATPPVKPLQTFPMRVGQEITLKEIEALVAEKHAAVEFITVATSLVETHQTLRDSFDTSSKDAQLAAVRKFVDQVMALRKATQSL